MYDYKCMGWYYPGQSGDWQSPANYFPATSGVYVVHVGYWATLNGKYGYYGNVESPTVTEYVT